MFIQRPRSYPAALPLSGLPMAPAAPNGTWQVSLPDTELQWLAGKNAEPLALIKPDALTAPVRNRLVARVPASIRSAPPPPPLAVFASLSRS